MTSKQQRHLDSMYVEKATLPKCPFTIFSEDGKTYCSYNYEAQQSAFRSILSSNIDKDIGIESGDIEAFLEGKIKEICSPTHCPQLK